LWGEHNYNFLAKYHSYFLTTVIPGVEETVIQTLGKYSAEKEVRGRNLTTDRSGTPPPHTHLKK
jgi:hypothetical protein